ncbi:MAG: metallophosphoesterase [Alphaproteobacteria bacterium]|uniref:metallophosphoesterase family protein n=1 Tax=Brevundimonas sp. TaxID=1871086 RepID=UPI0017D140E1|nr:metallophosphoesterase [Brevundimonas sp.]MBA3048606.1 metallophosphoesterase [Brevundimonas sp.]MBU3970205.1 metallophosphoesterase [Alphaproteobacteria bacterium]MBU3973492.1 metallophosphoesterase [Alphaproteobacteria bacterium]MBU4138164.1 metallophosphoesterase [Alphaproteobacteria bacterium]
MGRILQFSDVHFGREHRHACEAALDYAHATPHNLVLITGDITQQGLPDEFEAAGRWIGRMPDPRFVIVGNHDVPYWSLIARVFSPWKAFEQAIGHPAHDHQFLSPDLMVRGVVTARGWQARANWSKGVIDLDQTRKAAEALRQAPVGALRVLACHHPLIEMIGAPMTGEVKRGAAAAQIFAEAGVDLITTGHVHVPFALPISMGDHCSHAVGCGTLSHRERGAPPSFNQIDWDAHHITVTAIAWTGDRFEPHQTWRLPRRQDTRRTATAPDPNTAGQMEKAAV